jgi:type I restriction enzyme S subunit
LDWNWPDEVVQPLSAALSRRSEPVNREANPLASLTFGSLHFGGELSRRDMSSKQEVKGRLFFAHAGDVVYSKIDARNGAIGIVPEEMPLAAFSSEYPIYAVDPAKALPDYIKLLFRSKTFRDRINSLVSGASGRKRVEPATLESIHVPLPPLPIQQAIVDHWKQAQERVAEAKRKADEHEAQTEQDFLASLGMSTPKQINRPKFLALRFEQIERWAVASVINQVLNLDRRVEGIFPIVDLGELATVSYGLQKSPSNRPGLFARPYLRVANVRKGFLDLSEIKEIEVSDRELPAYLLQPDDILFVEGNGSRAELGRVAKWNGEIKNCVHQNHLIKVRVDQKRILPDYAMTWFNTELGRSHFFRSAKSSSGLGTINSSEVRKAPIPLPPLDIQRKLVAEITAARKRIAAERTAAAKLAADTAREVEEMILGYRPAPNT